MIKPKRRPLSKRAWLGIAWLLVVVFMSAHAGWLAWANRLAPDTDILTMLPVEERDPLLQQAINHMSSSAQQRVIVLVGAKDWPDAERAADAYLAELKPHADLLQQDGAGAAQTSGELLGQFWPHRSALLTPQQRSELASQPPASWLAAAQRQLYAPVGAMRVGAWQDDPFGLFAGWLQERAAQTVVRPSDGRLRVDAGAMQYVVLPMTMKASAFSLSAQQDILPLLQQAETAAHAALPEADVLAAGLVLHAGAASQQANNEINTIGWGSLAGVLLLMLVTFRSLRPIILVVLSVGIGCLAAVSVCWFVFDRLHMFTLVFGASLIGVAEDYGIHYLCARLGDEKGRTPAELLRHLLPGLSLAMATTALAYLALALTPFPGLRQVAVFSAVGLLGSWLTVVLWFPLLERGHLRGAEIAAWFGRSRAIWPRLRWDRTSAIVLGLCAVPLLIGLAELSTNDDIRLLQNSPPELIKAQIRVSALLAMPAPAQFYLVRAASAEQVLQQEEALKTRLDKLQAAHTLVGYRALSDWVPSQQRQAANFALVQQALLAPGAALSLVATELGEDASWVERLRSAATPAAPLLPETFLATKTGEVARHLWLGKVGSDYASIVTLIGVQRVDLATFQQTVEGLKGVQWVDKVGEISSLLGRYRYEMGFIVLLSYVAVYLMLLARYKRAAWRAFVPTALASAITLAVLGLCHQPLNLFHMLALLLILGMGVDFGIFLQEHPHQQDKAAWLGVGLSAASTLLSFGLLGLSQTPAIQAFGVTMLLGIGIVWMIAPCFDADPADDAEFSPASLHASPHTKAPPQ